MNITIDVVASTENFLKEQAQKIGLPLEKYVADLVEEKAVHGQNGTTAVDPNEIDYDEWLEIFNSRIIVNVPPIPLEFLRREHLYED